MQEFKEFQNKYDRQFHEMLKEEWKNLDVDPGPDAYEGSKPDDLPEIDQSDSPSKPSVSLNKSNKKNEKGTRAENPSVSEKEGDPTRNERSLKPSFDPEVQKASVATEKINFFERNIQYKYYDAFRTKVGRPINKKTIADFWKHLSTKDYGSFLEQVRQVKKEIKLDDYSYARLLYRIGSQIYEKNTAAPTLFTWFMLTQSEYNTRIGYNKEEVHLLAETQPSLFHHTYFTLNNTKYYVLFSNGEKGEVPRDLYTYEKEYPNMEPKPLELSSRSLPALPKEETIRELSFEFRDTSYTFEVPINKQLITYYKGYPNANFDLYVKSQLEEQTRQALLGSLEPLLEDKKKVEQVNLLLRFVQKAFEYKVDAKQFNSENYLFPQETLYYPASDCEDRASLFAYLIEQLTTLDYIGLRYPSHLTIAVHFPSQQIEGDTVEYNNKSYLITDPTYVNADVGMLMPHLQDQNPRVLDF